jgi:hypothetical protein
MRVCGVGASNERVSMSANRLRVFFGAWMSPEAKSNSGKVVAGHDLEEY